MMNTFRNAIQDGLEIISGKMTTYDFTTNFINNFYNLKHIENMLLFSSYYFNNCHETEKTDLIQNLVPIDYKGDIDKLMYEYFNNQKKVNFYVLYALYNVAYKHDALDTKYVYRDLRINIPNTALSALKILYSVFTNESKPYKKTLPPFALYDVFKYPGNHLTNSKSMERLQGFDNSRPEESVAQIFSNAYLSKDICRINNLIKKDIGSENTTNQKDLYQFIKTRFMVNFLKNGFYIKIN